MLNLKDYNRISHLFSISLKTIDHLYCQLLIFVGMIQVLRIEFLKFRIFEILNFHPWHLHRECSGSVGRALDWGSIVQDSLPAESLCIVFEQDTFKT